MTGGYPAGPINTAGEVNTAGEAGELEQVPSDQAGPAYPAVADPSGDPVVDTLTGRLAGIPDLPIDQHNSLYTGIHDGLLTELNANPEDHDAS